MGVKKTFVFKAFKMAHINYKTSMQQCVIKFWFYLRPNPFMLDEINLHYSDSLDRFNNMLSNVKPSLK